MNKIFYIFIITWCISFSCLGQEKKPFYSSEELKIKENIRIHLDRDVYLPSETIWFSGDYLINNQKVGDDLSKVLYVELF